MFPKGPLNPSFSYIKRGHRGDLREAALGAQALLKVLKRPLSEAPGADLQRGAGLAKAGHAAGRAAERPRGPRTAEDGAEALSPAVGAGE